MSDGDRELNLILPGNPRYQPKSLVDTFGYDNLYCTVAEVEIATMRVLGDIGVIPADEIALLTDGVVEQILAIPTTDVDKVEREITKHDIRAWVRKAQEILHQRLGRWTHVPLTSYDPLDTGRILQFQRAYQQALKPSIKDLVLRLAELTRTFADQIQVGRTHGQHALPITVGFWLATILSRVLYNAEKMELHASQLVGKISGAVGAHNAQLGLGFAEKCGSKSFEARVLEKVGLKPARISTQILPPEPLAYFLYSCQMLSASLAQLGRDGRNLMRSEIAEIVEAFEKGQVGSSTMAQKRNPINLENLEGMWIRTKNEFGKVQDTLLSEHQRDLVGSCVARDFPIIVVNVAQQLSTLLRKKDGQSFVSRIHVDQAACQRNFERSAHLILAEPLYIALQMAGFQGDAHELVNRQVVPVATERGCLLIDVVEEIAETDEEVSEALGRIPAEVCELLHEPQQYVGDSSQKALEIAELAEQMVA